MIYSKLKYLLFVTIFLISFKNFSQKNIYNSARINVIDANTAYFEILHNNNTKIVKNLAEKLKIQISRKLTDGRIIELKGVNEVGEPIFTISESNLAAGQTTFTSSVYNGGDLGLKISGDGSSVAGRLGIWDGGKVLNTHVEFGNRVTQMDNASTTSSHSTHVAGTMVAEGQNVIARGMAPAALLKAWDYNNDDAEMSAASKDLLVSNHSYGNVAGWVYNDTRTGTQKWEWYGNTSISNFEDYKFGFYDGQSQSWDKIAYNAPNYLIVKSAGNKGDETGPGISTTDTTKTLEKYYLGAGNDTSFVARSRNDSYDNLPTYSVAKNILTVGAVSIIPNGPELVSDIKIASFSSWGPTDDGRIKPDIVGAGVNLFSTTDVSTKSYTFLSGTSMSSPQVSGSIFLLQDIYSQLNSAKLMRSSTLKGLVLHTADDAGRPGPDYTYGWGLLNIENAAKVLLNKNKTYDLQELTLNPGATFTKKIVANGKDPIIATICWTDPEAPATSVLASNLNNRTPKLVNDLDILINDGTKSYQAWILDPNKPANNATKGDNIRDNVEQVYIPNPVPGKEYTITISHKNILSKSQDYALIMSGIGGLAYCTSTAASTEGTLIKKISLNGVIFNNENNCTKYSDNTNQKIEVSPNQKLNIELDFGTCGTVKDKSYAIYADWNIDGDFEDEGEKLLDPTALSGVLSFANSFNVPDNIVPGGNTRLRIITSETSLVTPCGSYANGETMDILMSYINPKTDLGIGNLIYPDATICKNSTIENISFEVVNKGTATIQAGEINIKIFENNIEIANQNAGIKAPILGLSHTNITIPITVSFKANSDYYFEIQSNILNDENPSNNLLAIHRTISADVLSTEATVVSCSDTDQISLITSGSGGAFWYDAEVGGNLIAYGNKASITKPSIPTNYYASQNDLQGQIGPITKKEFSGGTYSGNFGPKPMITTKTPIRLESARLYIGHNGKITFTVERISDLTPISSVSLDVVSTRNSALGNASNGQQLDDPTDPGAIYNLNLDIPEPGDYQISIDYEDGASIFRSNQGVSGFPFGLQNAVTIPGSSFNGGVLKEAWYYFYNLKIKSLGCASPKRTLAATSSATGLKGSITSADGTSICANQSITLALKDPLIGQYQWYKDGAAILNANNNSLLVNQKGNYYILISSNGVCPGVSNSLTIESKAPARPTITAEGNVLTSTEAETYQWLFSQKPITGAIQKVYTAYESGNYAIITKVDGCTVQSFETFVTILADEIIPSGEDLVLFPNPTADNFLVKSIKNNIAKYQIFNLLGQIVQENELKIDPTNPEPISIKHLPTGQYLIRIINGKNVFLRKIIKL